MKNKLQFVFDLYQKIISLNGWSYW